MATWRRLRRLLAAVALPLATLAVAPAIASAQPGRVMPAIDGPAPPLPPAVVSRDEMGRVTVRATRLSEPLVLDGRLEETIYQRVPAVSDFIQQEPLEGQPATEKTEAWILFDDRNVYVTMRCYDSRPDRLVANEMRRDNFNIYQNDNVTVVLDPLYTRRAGYFFQTNALGGLRDQEVTDEQTNNTDWNTVWHVKTSRLPDGWAMEMAIPFKSLRYRSAGPQVWGINLRRVVRWKNEQSFLSPVPASYSFRGIYKFSSAATLVGLETPAQSMNLELKPYAIASLTTNRTASIPFVNDVGGDGGFDLKYGLTRSLIADLTYRTDFSQVEEDQQQVNLTRFSLFFPEKRDFFLEGQGLFAFGGVEQRGGGGGFGFFARSETPSLTPILFFSRRIGLQDGEVVPIIAGGRLTGRVGRSTIGALNIQTDETAAGAVSTNFTVVRLRRDILRRSNIGLIATHRAPSLGPSGDNTVLGVDANFAFYENLRMSSYYARSSTNATSASEADRASYRGQLEYAGDRYGAELEHLVVGRRFNPEIGFLRRQAFRRNFGQLRFSPRTRASRLVRKYNFEASLDHITDNAGTLETRVAQGTFRLELHNNDQWSIDYSRSYEFLRERFDIADDVAIDPGGYRFQDVRSVYQFGPQRRVSGALTVGHGSFFDGTRTEAGYRGYVEVTPKLSLEPGVTLNWVDLDDGRFTTRLISTRLSHTLSPRAVLSTLVQYNSTSDSLNSSVRFRWEYQPGSDLFVVYSDGRSTDERGFPRLQNRTLAIKLTRLIRF